MATTKAKEDKPGDKSTNYTDLSSPTGKVEDVYRGASGGLAAEGYGSNNILGAGTPLGGVENARVANEGVAVRSPEEDEKRFKEAQKFMNSKVEFAKKEEEGPEVVSEALKAEKDKQEEVASKKPTAAGGQTQLDNPTVAQSAKETEKEEAENIAAAAGEKKSESKKK